MTRLYLRKNDLTKNPKLPYFTLCIIPEGEEPDAEWKQIGALWKSKSGNGYTGESSEGVVIDTTNLKSWKKDEEKEVTD